MKDRSLLFALLLAACAALEGCGPQYVTNYQFIEPKGSTGAACIYQCEIVKGQCQEIEQLKEDNCRARSETSEHFCEQRIRDQYGREPKWYECGGESCSSEPERCDETYRGCYTSCGGRVVAETRCVANCPPPSDLTPTRERIADH